MTTPTYCFVGVMICLKRTSWRRKWREDKRKQCLLRIKQWSSTFHLPLQDMRSGRWHTQSYICRWDLRQHKKFLIKLWVHVKVYFHACFLYNNNNLIRSMYMSWLLQNSLQEQMTQGSFVPHGYDDILNTAIRRLQRGLVWQSTNTLDSHWPPTVPLHQSAHNSWLK